MMNIGSEKILYILESVRAHLPQDIEDVLNDSESDPHYSAVYINNAIKCYIELMTQLGKELPYHDVESFFKFNIDPDEKKYKKFENSRKKESEYYRGIQY